MYGRLFRFSCTDALKALDKPGRLIETREKIQTRTLNRDHRVSSELDYLCFKKTVTFIKR